MLASVAGKIPSPDTKLRGQLDKAVFTSPRQRLTAPKRPRKEKMVRSVRVVNDRKVTEERLVHAFDGDYPLADTAFMVGPSVVAGMVSPHAGAISGVAGTASRATPPAMLQNIETAPCRSPRASAGNLGEQRSVAVRGPLAGVFVKAVRLIGCLIGSPTSKPRIRRGLS